MSLVINTFQFADTSDTTENVNFPVMPGWKCMEKILKKKLVFLRNSLGEAQIAENFLPLAEYVT